MARIAGYDVGGAHLKVAIVDNGRVVAARQIACPLWLGLDRLDGALTEAAELIATADHHAVTMTGELTEIFESRQAGVTMLVSHLQSRLTPKVQVLMGLKGFGTADDAHRNWSDVASANFFATALVIADLQPDALLIDFGSTTTDIIACDRPMGLTDADRLRTGELVYTGFTRTLVPAVTTRAPFDGHWQALARDGFATMADVRRILGQLADGEDTHATTDGRGTSIAESLNRFARGFGRDGDLRQIDQWRVAAAYVAERQLRSIHDGVLQVMSGAGARVTRIVAAGVGVKAVEGMARRLHFPSSTFSDAVSCDDPLLAEDITTCAPAVAVALLAERKITRGLSP
ncbi:MAG: hypothetical protein K2X41_08850 [Hyphomicrobium sp.]|nr:hypothetical protein [Hyphomicrobium sp.]